MLYLHMQQTPVTATHVDTHGRAQRLAGWTTFVRHAATPIAHSHHQMRGNRKRIFLTLGWMLKIKTEHNVTTFGKRLFYHVSHPVLQSMTSEGEGVHRRDG